MDKYVIEIPEGLVFKAGGIEKTLGIIVDVFGRKHPIPTDIRLIPYHEPAAEEIRQKVEDEVWEFASMLMDMHPDVAENIYRSMNGGKGIGVAAEMTYQEAKAKYDAWKKERDELRIGNEVELKQNHKRAIVFGCNDPDYIDVLYRNCCGIPVVSVWKKAEVSKTGRHFPELVELFEKMGK